MAEIVRPIDLPPIDEAEIPEGVVRLEEYLNDVSFPRNNLRRGQREALENTLAFLQEGGRTCYVEQASGYGKSRYMQEISRGFGGTQVFIVPGESSSSNIYGKLTTDGDKVGRVDKYRKEYGEEKTIITMPSLQRLYDRVSQGTATAQDLENARKVFSADIVFADEVHHFLTPKAFEVLSAFLTSNPNSVMIGATATEGYDQVKNSEVQFGKCLHRVSLLEAEREGVLISPHVKFVRTGQSLDKSTVDINGNIRFDNSISLEQRDSRLVDAYLEACYGEGKMLRAVAYASSLEHAQIMQEVLIEKGIASKVVTSNTKNREDIYGQLESGELSVVVTVGTAIESLDLQWLEAIMVSAQTRSARVARQMFPRAMRNMEGKKNPWIFQAIDDKTSYGNRPILATDILNVSNFRNGSIVTPRETFESYDHSSSQMDGDLSMDLEPGEEVDTSEEIIEIDSLFKMSLLDKAKVLAGGIESDDFKSEIRDQIVRLFKDRDAFIDQPSLHAARIYDEVIGEYITAFKILKSLFNFQESHLKMDQLDQIRDFIKGEKIISGKLDKDKVSYFISPELDRLAGLYKAKNLSGSQLVDLADMLRVVLGSADRKDLRIATYDSDIYRGGLGALPKRLGLGSTGTVSNKSLQAIFDIVNNYSEGEKYLLKEEAVINDNNALPILSEHPEIGDVKNFLVKVFEEAKMQGFNIKAASEMSGYRVEMPEFNGSLAMLMKRIRQADYPVKGIINRQDLNALLEYAGYLNKDVIEK